MMGLTSNLRVFLCLEPVDMRKSFNGLGAAADRLVADGLRNGALFVFTNKRRNRFKALYYDRTGVCVLAKRLETGTFSWPDPAHHAGQKISLTPESLHLLFDGVDLRGATLRPWYERDGK
jgi:transposase